MAVKSLKTSGIINQKKSNSMLTGYSFQDFELIDSVFLAANAASIVFSGLGQYSSEYKNLQIRFVARSTRSSTSDGTTIRFNEDSGSNYSRHGLVGDGASVTSYGLANQTYGDAAPVTAASSTSNFFGASITDILDAYTAKNKTVRSFGGITSVAVVLLNSGSWRNSSLVTSITVSPQAGPSFLAGSRFSIYGIR